MTKQTFTIELDAVQLQAIEIGLDLLRRQAVADRDDETLTDVESATVSVRDQQLVAEEVDSIDAGRLSLVSDVENWNAHCAASNSALGRAQNTNHLREAVARHYPTTTEKGHN